MRPSFQTAILIILIASCGQNPKQKSARLIKQDNDKLFVLYDTLDDKYNSVPTNFDTLYNLSKEIKVLADNYKKTDNQKIPEIYKRCADIFRVHCSDYCGSDNSPILCCKDSLTIIDCYLKAVHIYKANNDTTSEGYTDAIYQLADVYDQLKKSKLALPLRQDYLRIIKKREGSSSDMTADAFMFIGYTCELLNEFRIANNYYQQELKIREQLNKGNLKIVRDRIANFQKEHNLSDN